MNQNVIRTLTVRAQEQGVSEVKGKLDAMAASQQKVSATADGMAVATDTSSRKALSAAGAFQRMTERLDRTVYLENQMAKQTALASRALEQGVIDGTQYAATLDLINRKYEEQVGLARRAGGAMEAVNNNLSFQRRNLQFQLMDIGQSLAGGMPAMMVLMQQGPQIAQIWGAEEGGVGRAFRETGQMAAGMLTKFAPLLAVVGALAGGVAVLTREMQQAGAESVNFMDVAAAAFQVPAQALYDYLEPAIDAVSDWWGRELDIFADQTKLLVNFLVSNFLVGFETLKAGIATLPDAFIVAGEGAANGFLKSIEWLVQKALEGVNLITDSLQALVDKTGLQIDVPDLVDPSEFKIAPADFGGSAAQARLDAAGGQLDRRNAAIRGTDYGGQWFGAIMDQAQNNAAARLAEENADAMSKAADAAQKMAEAYAGIVRGGREFIASQNLEAQALGMTEEAANRLRYEQELLNQAANDNIALSPAQRGELSALAAEMAAVEERTRSLTQWYEFGKSTFGSFMSDFKRDLMNGTSLWQSFGNAAAKALDSIADRALSMAANGLFDMIFGAIIGGIGGGFGTIGVGGVGMPTGGFVPGLTGPKLFADGGYTGNFGISEPAGIVHGQEYVLNAAATRRIGRSALDAMNAGRVANSNQANDNAKVEFHMSAQINLNGSATEEDGAAAARGWQAEMKRWKESGEGARFVRDVTNGKGRY